MRYARFTPLQSNPQHTGKGLGIRRGVTVVVGLFGAFGVLDALAGVPSWR
jgi:hypothetical protein